MSRYISYTPSQNETTTLRFIDKGIYDSLEVRLFDTHVVAVSGLDSEFEQLLSDQHQECNAVEITFDEFYPLAFKSSQAQFQLEQLAKKFKTDCDALTGGVPVDEALSWKKQEERAREYLADTTQQSPQLEALALSRGLGETVEQLAVKIVTNADNYEMAHLTILGEYQAAKKAVFA